MKLPHDCIRALKNGARYISVTMPWRGGICPADFLTYALQTADLANSASLDFPEDLPSAEEFSTADSCYWRTPDGSMELLGIGSALLGRGSAHASGSHHAPSAALHTLGDLRAFQENMRRHVCELYLHEADAQSFTTTETNTFSSPHSSDGAAIHSSDGHESCIILTHERVDDTYMGAGFIAMGGALYDSADSTNSAEHGTAQQSGSPAHDSYSHTHSASHTERSTERRRTWGELSEGYFFVPAILIRSCHSPNDSAQHSAASEQITPNAVSQPNTLNQHSALNQHSNKSQYSTTSRLSSASQHTVTFNIEADSAEELSQRWKILTEYAERILRWVCAATDSMDNSALMPSSQPDAAISACPESDSSPSPQEKHLSTAAGHSSSETFTRERWAEAISSIKSEFESSALKKVVLARRLHITAPEPINPHAVLSRLQGQQPHTYSFMLTSGSRSFISTTPERLLWADSRQLRSASIAGSAPRGHTPADDERLGTQLLNDAKNLYEHQIVVDYIAGGLESFTEGTPRTSGRHLLKNRDIQHLEILVSGARCPDTHLIDALEALHPTPALGGMPQQRALEIQRELEPVHRGLYGGPIGWISLPSDVGEFAVGIRSGLIHDREAYVYAGCGIVPRSDDEEEWQETARKFRPMLRGIHDE